MVSSAVMANAQPTLLRSVDFSDLPAWRDDDHGAALAAFLAPAALSLLLCNGW